MWVLHQWESFKRNSPGWQYCNVPNIAQSDRVVNWHTWHTCAFHCKNIDTKCVTCGINLRTRNMWNCKYNVNTNDRGLCLICRINYCFFGLKLHCHLNISIELIFFFSLLTTIISENMFTQLSLIIKLMLPHVTIRWHRSQGTLSMLSYISLAS